jgi:hypothetical protein
LLLNLILVYIRFKCIVKRVKSLKYVANQSHNYITDCNESDDSGDISVKNTVYSRISMIWRTCCGIRRRVTVSISWI